MIIIVRRSIIRLSLTVNIAALTVVKRATNALFGTRVAVVLTDSDHICGEWSVLHSTE